MEIKMMDEIVEKMRKDVLDPGIDAMASRAAEHGEDVICLLALVATTDGAYVASRAHKLVHDHVDTDQMTRDLLGVLASHMSGVPNLVVLGGARPSGVPS
jgi:hypothetical protein